ncbi:hypothetical protein [Tateyamaria pelophila]|uniref:hypothetical protein n=1 Tax=Tateyamaria pelophila TaxID=328415 RepID=UPI001CBEA767
MAHPTKIATCCYCGTRAALVLAGKERHELACSSCGAPLHNLKMLPKNRTTDRMSPRPSAMQTQPRPKPSKKKMKRRKSRWGELFEDVFDIVEDIFD